MSTELVEGRTLDLTRAPNEQWNKAMVAVVVKNVFRGTEITEPQLYYCLSVAESLALNPMIGEIYFLPSKSRDAKGPAWTPYIGRNGLVKKAGARGYYYESDTVHEKDKFRILRRMDGTRTCTHSYSAEDRGEIVGAYAFLHDRSGAERPSFFYAKLEEYLPTFDQDWKMEKSPWGNQRSAMIEKCAMIGAGRKRLDLGNVLVDAEGAIVEQMGAAGPRPGEPAERAEFDWDSLAGGHVTAELRDRLRDAVQRVNELDPMSWPAAKCEMAFSGRTHGELEMFAERIEEEANQLVSAREGSAAGRPEGDAGGTSGDGSASAEDVTEAQVVPDEEVLAGLRHRAGGLEARLEGAEPLSREFSELSAELDMVNAEIEAVENPDQGRLV